MRKQVPPEKTASVLEFATKKPEARLESIVKGLQVLQYGQSEYLRSFGLSVDATGPVKINGRVLNPPTLIYGAGSRQATVVSFPRYYAHLRYHPPDSIDLQNPRNGEWNMIDKKLYKPASIQRWIVVIYERKQRFSESAADDMVGGLRKATSDMGTLFLPSPSRLLMRTRFLLRSGITGFQAQPRIEWENPQSDIIAARRFSITLPFFGIVGEFQLTSAFVLDSAKARNGDARSGRSPRHVRSRPPRWSRRSLSTNQAVCVALALCPLVLTFPQFLRLSSWCRYSMPPKQQVLPCQAPILC